MASALNRGPGAAFQRWKAARRQRAEITGTEGDTITMQELFRFERQGMDAAR
jgi:hypothetical protein